jgi:hypothetical protein
MATNTVALTRAAALARALEAAHSADDASRLDAVAIQSIAAQIAELCEGALED